MEDVRGRRDNRSILPLAAVPTRYSSFRLLTLSCRYGMLFGSDCNDKRLRDVTGAKRGETVGLTPSVTIGPVRACLAEDVATEINERRSYWIPGHLSRDGKSS